MLAVATFAVLSVSAPCHGGEVTDGSNTRTKTLIGYLTLNGSQATATPQERGFLPAPEGNWLEAHPDIIINYLTWDRGKWTAKLK
jgi:hypothetical protein